MAVHSILPPLPTGAVDEALRAAGVRHVAHGDDDPVGAATEAASDPAAIAVIGPFRSADVAEAVEGTARRAKTLAGMRALGFDEHGDPLDPVVRFERYEA